MKVLLTNPLKPKPTESPLDLPAPMMPLGLGFIAAVVMMLLLPKASRSKRNRG